MNLEEAALQEKSLAIIQDLFKGGVIYNKPRQKDLKDTLSWSTNAILKLFYALKP